MSMFIQYAPYKLAEGDWDAIKDGFADRCFDILEEYAPGFKASVIARQVVSPLDLERTFNLTGGNIFQGALGLSQLFSLELDNRLIVELKLTLLQGNPDLV